MLCKWMSQHDMQFGRSIISLSKWKVSNIEDQDSAVAVVDIEHQFIDSGTPTVSYRITPVLAETADMVR